MSDYQEIARLKAELAMEQEEVKVLQSEIVLYKEILDSYVEDFKHKDVEIADLKAQLEEPKPVWDWTNQRDYVHGFQSGEEAALYDIIHDTVSKCEIDDKSDFVAAFKEGYRTIINAVPHIPGDTTQWAIACLVQRMESEMR